MKKVSLYILTMLLVLTACGKKTTPSKPDVPTPQTTLMYMCGTDLSYFFGLNITAIKSAVSNKGLGNGRFLIFKHSTPSEASLVEYKYEKGVCTTETLKEYSDISSLSLEAITEVVADTKEFAPADKYNLIVSGHATGWVSKDYNPASSWRVAPSTPLIDWSSMSSGEHVTRFLGSTNDGLFDIDEFRESLEAAQTPFGYILFDQCFMSSVEALYEMRGLCDYIIASPCEIMGPGFPYDTVIPKLFANNGSESDLQGVCQEFYEYYAHDYSINSGCVALTVTSELEALATATRNINALFSDEAIDLEELQAYERLKSHLFFDLEDYILTKCEDAALSEAFVSQMNKTFPLDSRFHTTSFYSNVGKTGSSYSTIDYYSGVTTSEPSKCTEASNWESTAWAQAVRVN